MLTVDEFLNTTEESAFEHGCSEVIKATISVVTSATILKILPVVELILSLYIILLSLTIKQKTSLKWYTVNMFTTCFVYGVNNTIFAYTDFMREKTVG
ncbi:unnamed protein product [Gongylonema pulchrum]|uniref:G_PROTEIN_RECEP_F1_2 domain-containing protein n=1 Tax=Gongylonema pulchrum TaxID=637853 RepID=A0A183EJT1_9BILA|nr:unnamed protein product [Gongylonema pulchrum]